MKLTKVRPMLNTVDLEATIQFYTTILGFAVTGHAPEIGWANLQWGEVEIMFQRPNEHMGAFNGPKLTGSIYFNTDDVEGMWDRVKGKVKVCYEPETFEYGMREFGIFDNNGYLLQFAQPVEGDAIAETE